MPKYLLIDNSIIAEVLEVHRISLRDCDICILVKHLHDNHKHLYYFTTEAYNSLVSFGSINYRVSFSYIDDSTLFKALYL